jgi:hypothetical protein
MGIAKVKSVIHESFDKFNIHLEEPVDGSLQLMVEQITDPKAGIALPYLQVYLDMLYRVTYRKKYGKEGTEEQLPPLEITRSDITTLGRIGNVLEKFLMQQTAELNTLLRSEYSGFPENGIELILDPFATDDGTKRPLHYNRSGDQIELDASVQAVLPKLPVGSLTRAIELMDQARILRIREDTMELAHDSLAAVVDRKRTDEQRKLQDLRRRLTNGYDEFQKTGVHLNAKQLASFEEYLPKLQLTDELTSFIKKSEEATRQEAEAERMREQQEQQSKHHKKLARVRGVLLTLVAIFAGGAVLFAMKSTKNYKDASVKGEKLTKTLDTIQMQQDSIENILIQVNQQLGRMDSVVDGHFKEQYKIEIQKSVITLKSLVSNDTISDEEMLRNHASAVTFLTTSYVDDNGNYGGKEEKFAMGQDVYVYARIDPRKPVELLQLKWMGPDQKIVGSPVYQEVDSALTKRRFVASAKFELPGRYQARLYNSAGKEIGQANFVISERPRSVLSVSEFKIVESVSGGKPGRETKRFASGKTVYFWGRIICPVSKAIVVVEIIYPSGNKEPIKYEVALNTNPGYMLWDGKGFGETGNYRIRILDDRGNELLESGFEIYSNR